MHPQSFISYYSDSNPYLGVELNSGTFQWDLTLWILVSVYGDVTHKSSHRSSSLTWKGMRNNEKTVLSGQLVSQRECTTISFNFEQYTIFIKSQTLMYGWTGRNHML